MGLSARSRHYRIVNHSFATLQHFQNYSFQPSSAEQGDQHVRELCDLDFGAHRTAEALPLCPPFMRPNRPRDRNRLYPDVFTRSPRWRGEQRKRKGDSVNSLFIFLRLSLTWSRTRLDHIGRCRSGKAFGESKGGRGDPTFDAPTS